MSLTDILEKWGRTIFEEPFGPGRPKEPPEVAEIRFAILDEIRKKSYRSGGRRVFPYNVVRINMRGVQESRKPIFKGGFFKKYFEQEIRKSLTKSDCRFPEDLEVDVNVTRRLPKRDEAWLWIETDSQRRRPTETARPAARIVVIEGKANQREIVLRKMRTNIGRTVDVYRSEGLSRRNDITFSEDTEVNRTVSREHAHIQYDEASSSWRLYNDRWYQRGEKGETACNVWIVRDGMSQEVHRNARGARLRSGDEIHLGKAVVRFLT